jgi:hypothetical protein
MRTVAALHGVAQSQVRSVGGGTVLDEYISIEGSHAVTERLHSVPGRDDTDISMG